VQEPQIVQVQSRNQSPGNEWLFEFVILAATRSQRLRGLRPRSRGRAMVLRSNSVHGFGMKESLVVIFLGPSGKVLGVAPLPPRSVVRHKAAFWVLELPPGSPIPEPGTVLEVGRRSL
jgi:uncharacterized membrane protein (UPF0127 family)